MRKSIIYIFFILFIIGGVYFLFRFLDYKEKNITYIKTLNSISSELNTYRKNFTLEIKNSNYQLMSESILNDFLYKSGDSIAIVCRFSETHCESCVNYSINRLLNYSDTIGEKNIVFITSYENEKLFEKQKEIYKITSFTSVNIKDIGLPAESLGYPYYFVLNKNKLTISNVFFPDKNTPNITDSYIYSISKRYFNIK